MAVAYNPRAYVPGGASPAVAKAIQAQGYRAKYPAVAPNKGYGLLNPGTTYTPPAVKNPSAPPPPNTPSSQQDAASQGGGAPTGTASSYIPGEGIYAQDSAAAYDAYNAAIAAAEKDTGAARAQYGFNADGSNLDPYNSTGLMQQLMRANAQQSMADEDAAQARGLGGSGLGAQVAHQGDYQASVNLANSANAYQGLLAAALAKKGDAQTALTNALLTARQNQLQYDLQNQLFNMFNSPGGGDNSGGGDNTTPPPADSSGVYYNPKTKQTTTSRPRVLPGQVWMT